MKCANERTKRTRETPPYIGSEAWETSEWEMLGRTSDERREARGEKREARGRAPREVMCAAAARRERGDAKGNERRAKRARREEREARGGRPQIGGEGRAARAGTEKSCAKRP